MPSMVGNPRKLCPEVVQKNLAQIKAIVFCNIAGNISMPESHDGILGKMKHTKLRSLLINKEKWFLAIGLLSMPCD